MRILLVLLFLLPAIDADAKIFGRRRSQQPVATQPACPGGVCPNPNMGGVQINYKGGFDVPPPAAYLQQPVQQPVATVVQTPATVVQTAPAAPAATIEANANQLQAAGTSEALVEALRLNLAAVSAAVEQLAQQQRQQSEAVQGQPAKLVKQLPIVRLQIERRDGGANEEAVIDLAELTKELLTE